MELRHARDLLQLTGQQQQARITSLEADVTHLLFDATRCGIAIKKSGSSIEAPTTHTGTNQGGYRFSHKALNDSLTAFSQIGHAFSFVTYELKYTPSLSSTQILGKMSTKECTRQTLNCCLTESSFLRMDGVADFLRPVTVTVIGLAVLHDALFLRSDSQPTSRTINRRCVHTSSLCCE